MRGSQAASSLLLMDSNNNNRSGRRAAESDRPMLEMRMYVLLLAILATTVTYVAGLNPPGGVWLDTQGGHVTGNQVLVVTYHTRYNAFSYSNATAFMASGVVILLLLLAKCAEASDDAPLFVVLRCVMALDLLALVAAYAAGASRDTLTTVLAMALVSPVFFYLLIHTVMLSCRCHRVASRVCSDCEVRDPAAPTCNRCKEAKRGRKILLLLAIFAATIAYTAGLNPPGGFWPDTQEGHRAGDPVLQHHHWRRFLAFFICNTVSFVASLFVIMLLLTDRLFWRTFVPPFVFTLTSLLGLVGAYACGSSRETDSTAGVTVIYVVGFVLVLVLVYLRGEKLPCFAAAREEANGHPPADDSFDAGGPLSRFRSIVLLLATLGVTVTYTAGLNPPGGFWPDDRDGHKGGDPILLAKQATRYRVFLYCNSTALAASMVVVFMVQKNLHLSRRRHTLEAVLLVDMISLIGAYAAGCCREAITSYYSIYVIALAGVALLLQAGLWLHGRHHPVHVDTHMAKKRKLLLLLAVLAATLTYQAGLTPPGGFWLGDDNELGHRAGDPVLLSNYPSRYKAFFYLNATSFMASVALIVIMLSPYVSSTGVRCHALCVCMVAGLLSLMGAYAAGSSRHVRTSIFTIALVGLVFIFIIILLLVARVWPQYIYEYVVLRGVRSRTNSEIPSSAARAPNNNGADTEATRRNYGVIQQHTWHKYLMLLGILAASITYQAGLAPPGGFWPDNNDGHAVGNPILRDSNHRRYRIFFLFNSTAFMAAVVVITLLLFVELISVRRAQEADDERLEFLLKAAHYTLGVDLIGLLGAYAAGSSREWETSGYIVALVVAVPLFIVVQIIPSITNHSQGIRGASGSNENGSIQVRQV